jgi:Zn-dependent protease
VEQITFGLIWYVAFLFSTTCHEAAHAFAALKLGDPTAYHGGQVSLNPVPHVQREPLGTVLVPIISFFAGGWMLGWASAPYDPYWAERYPKRSALMSLAGPCANLLLLVLAGIVMRIGLELGQFQVADGISFAKVVVPAKDGFLAGVSTLVSIMFTLNLLLLVFNLLPLPPLDGSGAIPLVLPDEQASRYVEFLHQPGFHFLFLFMAWRAMDYIFGPVFSRALDLLLIGV